MTSLKQARATYIKTDIGMATVVKQTTPKGSMKLLRSVVRAGVKSTPSLYDRSRIYQHSTGLYLQNPNRVSGQNEQVDYSSNLRVVPTGPRDIPTNNGDSGNSVAPNETVPTTDPGSNRNDIGQSDYATLAWNTYHAYETKGYVIDSSLSDTEATVYVDQSGKAILAFIGTEPKDMKQFPSDLVADIHVATGHEEQAYEFQHAIRKAIETVHKYGAQNIVVVGHSLGGTKAMYVSHKLGLKAEVYNAGWSPADVFRHSFTVPKWLWSGSADNRPQYWNLSNVTSHVIIGDAFSNSQYLQPGLKVQTEGIGKGFVKTAAGAGVSKVVGGGMVDVVQSIASGLGAGPLGIALAGASAVGIGIATTTADAHKMENFVADRKFKSQPKAFVQHPLGGYDIGAHRSHGNAWGFA